MTTLPPWTVETGVGPHGGYRIDIIGTEDHPARKRVHVASFELEEDATLCCSAPGLYEALEALVAVADDAGWQPDYFPLVRAHQALAEARGEEVKP